MNKIILSAVIAIMLSTPIAWADGHRNVKEQPVKIIITQPVQHVVKNPVTKNNVVKRNAVKRNVTKNHVVKNYVAKNNVTHRSIRTKPVNNQHHNQNKAHTGKLISNVVGLLWVIK